MYILVHIYLYSFISLFLPFYVFVQKAYAAKDTAQCITFNVFLLFPPPTVSYNIICTFYEPDFASERGN